MNPYQDLQSAMSTPSQHQEQHIHTSNSTSTHTPLADSNGKTTRAKPPLQFMRERGNTPASSRSLPLSYTPSNISGTTSLSRTTSRSGRRSRPGTSSGRRSRTTTSSVVDQSESQNIVCAISEARGVSPSVGIASINATIGEIILSQICDNQSYVRTIHKMQMTSPSRVIFMPSAVPPIKPSPLLSLVDELVPEAKVEMLERGAWSQSAGLAYVQNLAFASDVEPLKVALQGKYYAVSSFAAVCML